MTKTCAVVVVGSGILGKSITFELARRGTQCICVGTSHDAPGTASSAAGAMLGVLGEVVHGRSRREDDAEFLFRLEASKRYPEFLDRIASTGGELVPLGLGTFIVANLVNREDRANLAAISDAALAAGLRCENVDPTDVPGLRAARGYEPVAALFAPDEGYVDATALLRALTRTVEALPAAGAIEATVRAVNSGSGGVTGVALDDGTRIDADVVVLANGVGVQELLHTVGVNDLPGLLPGKGVSLTVTAPEIELSHVIRTPNRDFACGTHVVPRGQGIAYIGATNRIGATPGATGVTPGEIHALLHSALHEINVGFRTVNVCDIRFGLRPLTTDSFPLVGFTGFDGLYVATGTYRNGMLMAPLVAAVIAAGVDGEEGPENPFAPSLRADFGRRTAEAVIDEGVRQLVSFVLEPGGSMPYNRQAELEEFLVSLARVAFGESESADGVREAVRTRLADAPIAETVAQFFYQLADETEVATDAAGTGR